MNRQLHVHMMIRIIEAEAVKSNTRPEVDCCKKNKNKLIDHSTKQAVSYHLPMFQIKGTRMLI